MRTIELKTNIMCSSCVANVTPSLNATFGESNWKVDTQNPSKILTVTTDELNDAEVIKAVTKAGYRAEKVA